MRIIKSLLKKIISRESWFKFKALIPIKFQTSYIEKLLITDWLRERKKHPWVPSLNRNINGINIVGFMRTTKGIAEAARSSIHALDAVNIPYTIIDYEFGIPASQQTETLPQSQNRKDFHFNVNLIHVNPPQLPYLWNTFGKSKLTKRYNIGVWYWELPNFPEEWSFAFDLMDEVWVATQFVLNSVSVKSSVPVVKIPPCIHVVYDHTINELDFNLPDDRFLFLCAYDVLSTQARKNPLGAIKAFKRAFKKNDPTVGLVLKINNARENPSEIKQLYDELRGYSNCYFVEDVLERTQFNALLNLVDSYISLHRSEGFGMIPAEAMSLGKPVIMTRWSGNLDLMTEDNSCGVDYKLIPVEEKSGPYLPGQIWAEPDINHAALFMEKLRYDGKYYSHISKHATKFIRENFSPVGIGQQIIKRMSQIGVPRFNSSVREDIK